MRKLLAPVLAVGLLLAMVGTVLAWVQPTLTSECAPDGTHYAWKINLHSGESNYNIDWSFNSDFEPFTTVNFVTPGDHSFVTPRTATTLYVRWSSDKNSKTQATANGELCQPPPEPGIEITKTHNAEGAVDPGTLVTYTYKVKNTGETPLSTVVVNDEINGSDNIACAVNSSVYTGDNGNGILDVGETWTFSCSTTLQVTTVNQACVSAEVGDAPNVEACATAEVEVAEEEFEAGGGTPAATLADTSIQIDGSSPLPAIVFGMVLLASLGALAYTNVKVVRAPHRNR